MSPYFKSKEKVFSIQRENLVSLEKLREAGFKARRWENAGSWDRGG
jgi:hypothetical protein